MMDMLICINDASSGNIGVSILVELKHIRPVYEVFTDQDFPRFRARQMIDIFFRFLLKRPRM